MTKFKLDRPPLVFVLAQVVMSPVSALEKYVNDIQDSLRKKGFPLFSEEIVTELVVQPPQPPQTKLHKRWHFQSVDNRSLITLDQNGFVFQTNNYSNFENFSNTFKSMTTTIFEVTGVSLVIRQGLRFVNYIRTSESMPLDFFLKERLLGLEACDEIEVTNVSKSFEQIDRTSTTQTLITRIIQVRDGSFLTADLGNIKLVFKDNGQPFYEHNRPERDTLAAILDLDHFAQEQKAFSVESIIQQFVQLHGQLEKRFRDVVKQEPFEKVWGYHEVT